MVRPRWHDALLVVAVLGLLVAAVVGLLVAGVWSLWWDDVRSILRLGPGSGDAAPPIAQGQT